MDSVVARSWGMGARIAGRPARGRPPRLGRPRAARGRRPGRPPVPLHYDLVLDLSITGAALASAAVLGILKPELAPLQCRFCAPNALDDSIQRGVVWRDPQAADTWSSVVANV